MYFLDIAASMIFKRLDDMEKIKILFVHGKLVCGGAEQALYDLICLLDKTKFDVSVLVQYAGGIWEQKFRDAGIEVIDIWNWQKKSKNPAVKLTNFFKRKIIKYLSAKNPAKLIDVCLQKKYDIIVSYSVWSNYRMGLHRHSKAVYYIHCDANTNEPMRNLIMDMKDLLPEYDQFVCVSDVARMSFEALTGITDRVAAIWNPLNSDRIRKLAEAPVDISSDVPVICAVGRLAQEKGFARLIRIHKDILEMGIPHKLVIVGAGPEKENLEHTIEETKTTNSVIMTGYRANPYPYMKNAMFLACSSYTEGLPVIAMEALSLGIPIVSAVPAIGELFGGDMCSIVTENDDESLKQGLIRMLTDQEYYLRAKKRSRKAKLHF